MNQNSKQQKIFNDDAKAGIVEYGSILIGVHTRLVMEGYFLKDGKTWNIFKVGKIVCEFILKEGDLNY